MIPSDELIKKVVDKFNCKMEYDPQRPNTRWILHPWISFNITQLNNMDKKEIEYFIKERIETSLNLK